MANSNSSKESHIRLAAEGAKRFVETYYPALNSDRTTLASFYHPAASIVWNGNPIASGEAFAAFFASMPDSHYDVQSYDAQPMQFDVKGSCSFVLIVSGSVKYGELKEQRGFSETFVLKPVEVQPTRYLISTQGFRLVV
ncbi:hypothetical protein DFP73DRAFT_562563 [Morchella snyderi]|nr:hypothetical protein DFP73DRAFT_562563 [Morchella snyderi]